MSTLIIGSIQLGFLYAAMAMGVYISFRILNTADLTVDGSFTLGMAVAAMLTVSGHPYIGVLLAIICGALAGCVTGILQTVMKIHPILASILTMTGLYSVNIAIMEGKSNVSLVGQENIFSSFQKLTEIDGNTCKTILPIIVCAIVLIIMIIFYKTRMGLAIRATGDNENMVESSSINANIYKCLGLAIANALVALSGAIITQYQSFSDVGSGSGMVVIGLASVIIGETLVGKRTVTIGFVSAIVGSVIYRIIIAIALKFDLFPSYALKIISAIIVVIALIIPNIKQNVSYRRARKREEV